MTDQDFKERVLNFIQKTENFIAKTEEWKQQVSRELGWIRGKLEGKEEAVSAMWGKVGAAAGFAAALIALIALILSLK